MGEWFEYSLAVFFVFRGDDNYWICKFWNLVRSLDIYIIKSFYSVIRYRESFFKVGSYVRVV